MLAAGVLLSGLQNMSIDIAMERSDGTLKRLGGTPLSPVSYFIGKLGQVLVTGSCSRCCSSSWRRCSSAFPCRPSPSVADVRVGVPAGRDDLRDPRHRPVGAAAHRPQRDRAFIPIVLLLQFISGVYINFAALPEWLQNVASVFPLKWLAQGFRSVFLPEGFAAAEPSGSWDHPLILMVTALWLVVGLAVVRVTFRWIRKDA